MDDAVHRHASLRRTRCVSVQRSGFAAGIGCENFAGTGNPSEPVATVAGVRGDVLVETSGETSDRIEPPGRNRHWQESSSGFVPPRAGQSRGNATEGGFIRLMVAKYLKIKDLQATDCRLSGQNLEPILRLHAALERRSSTLFHGRPKRVPEDSDPALAPLLFHGCSKQRSRKPRDESFGEPGV